MYENDEKTSARILSSLFVKIQVYLIKDDPGEVIDHSPKWIRIPYNVNNHPLFSSSPR